MTNKQIKTFIEYPDATQIFVTADGEIFLKLKYAQAYADSIGITQIDTIARPTNLPPLSGDIMAPNDVWTKTNSAWRWMGDFDIATRSELEVPSLENRMLLYRIKSSNNSIVDATLTFANDEIDVVINDYIQCTINGWEKLFDADVINVQIQTVIDEQTAIATQKADLATQKAALAVEKANLASQKADDAGTSATNARNSEVSASSSKDDALLAKQQAIDAKDIATQKANEAKTLGYQGTWNALTNTPTLMSTPNPTLADGSHYEVIAEGVSNITGQTETFKFGDQLKKSGSKWDRIPAANTIIKEQSNPDKSFVITDAEDKEFGYFDEHGTYHGNIEIGKDNVNTDALQDKAVTKEKLEISIQNLLNLLSSFSYIDDMQGAGWIITDAENKQLLEIGADGKIRALFDFSLSPIQQADLSPDLLGLVGSTFDFDPNFQEYAYYMYDLEDKIVFGIRADGTSSLPTQIQADSIGLNELKQEVKDLLLSLTKLIVFWGDSLTAGAGGNGTTTPSVMQTLMPNYTVVNAGVGGENVPTISARIGSMPCFITSGFTLPANTSTIEISSVADPRLKNALGANVAPLKQGNAAVNPCFIEGVECTLAWNNTEQTYTIKRNVAGFEKVIKANTPLIMRGAKTYRDANIIIIEVGQNGGYTSTDEYIKYVDAIINYNRKSNFIIVGQHTGTPASRLELETRCQLEYGLKYINMREYISGNAMYDLGLIPTTQDLTAMANGGFPPSFWASTTDSVHGNANFYTAKANKIYSRILELGY